MAESEYSLKLQNVSMRFNYIIYNLEMVLLFTGELKKKWTECFVPCITRYKRKLNWESCKYLKIYSFYRILNSRVSDCRKKKKKKWKKENSGLPTRMSWSDCTQPNNLTKILTGHIKNTKMCIFASHSQRATGPIRVGSWQNANCLVTQLR